MSDKQYTVEDVRAAFVEGMRRAWFRICNSVPERIETEFQAEALRRYPDKEEKRDEN